jgi:hypothetical protein
MRAYGYFEQVFSSYRKVRPSINTFYQAPFNLECQKIYTNDDLAVCIIWLIVDDDGGGSDDDDDDNNRQRLCRIGPNCPFLNPLVVLFVVGPSCFLFCLFYLMI